MPYLINTYSKKCKTHLELDLLRIVLTCRPQVASWIHFNFRNFIPQLGEVETDRGAQRREGEDEQQRNQATLADVVEREASHCSGESSSRAGTASQESSSCTLTALFYPAFIAPAVRGWAVFTLRALTFQDPLETASDEVGLAGERLWLCVFYARHDSCLDS